MDGVPDWLIEAAIAVGAVGIMFGFLYWLGSTYTTNGQLSSTGGQMFVVGLVLFLLLMGAVGVGLAYTMTGADSDGSAN